MYANDDNFNIDTKKIEGVRFNNLFNQTVWEAIKTCDWTGDIIDRKFGYTEAEALANLI